MTEVPSVIFVSDWTRPDVVSCTDRSKIGHSRTAQRGRGDVMVGRARFYISATKARCGILKAVPISQSLRGYVTKNRNEQRIQNAYLKNIQGLYLLHINRPLCLSNYGQYV